ncbi:alpha/beta-type small acid-soluble spore protein [Crassaminicella thermophila]|uniref:Alpha/beta-type small acid-soluble spore protein n=1 Tax=Crassaminicella thermophila TaxID=2599308 RepID=A0A5C0SFB1_CRATE|nr:alpha/beta-type small acid-soluble spore protein [Crassaminicella thermophila]QEK12466.1 alpha/beta-type small acid-soluble spore protein [Crassaminicella thermophila]
MTRKKLVVPEARTALDQFKMEMAKELGINDSNPIDSSYLASYHTGLITRKLVEMAEKELTNK